jgi:hypothetical protein
MVIWYILLTFGIVHGIYFHYGMLYKEKAGNGVDIYYGHLVYFTAIWYILWPFGIFCGHLVYFVAIWYILWPFGIFCGHLV